MKCLNKKFYSDELLMSFNMSKNGNLMGEMTKKINNVGDFRKEFSGIYVQNDLQTSLSFFTEIAGILTCYAGKMFHYPPDGECLFLRFWSINELLPTSPSISSCKSLLLFDCPRKNAVIETHKVIDFIPEGIFVTKYPSPGRMPFSCAPHRSGRGELPLTTFDQSSMFRIIS